jgi:hypothetical protein
MNTGTTTKKGEKKIGPLTREDLFSLEEYAVERPEFRKKIIAHKKNRIVPVGPNATIHFEDSLTMQYQIQEMLRIERIFEPAGIQEELDVYNPLIPTGSNLKATFMFEWDDPEERLKWLKKLVGAEDKIWIQVEGFDKVYAIANEDLERSTEEKTSSVHFLRFELTPEMKEALKKGATLKVGIDHPEYHYEVEVPENVRASLLEDLD